MYRCEGVLFEGTGIISPGSALEMYVTGCHMTLKTLSAARSTF